MDVWDYVVAVSQVGSECNAQLERDFETTAFM